MIRYVIQCRCPDIAGLVIDGAIKMQALARVLFPMPGDPPAPFQVVPQSALVCARCRKRRRTPAAVQLAPYAAQGAES